MDVHPTWAAHPRWLALGITVWLTTAVLLARANDSLETRRQALELRFAAQLERIADKCIELDLPVQAEATRRWEVSRLPTRSYFFLPPAAPMLLPPTADIPSPIRQWHRKLSQVRGDHAARLMELFEEALSAEESELAYALLHQAFHADPAQSGAANVLGFGRSADSGQPGDDPVVQPAQAQHPVLGWPAGTYWRIKSRHYHIVTNHEGPEAVELARRLEDLHTVWRQLFFTCWSDQASLATAWRRQRPLLPPSRPDHRVVLFRNRDDYIKTLRPVQPQIEITVGYYDAPRRTSYFFVGDPSTRASWFHEATHQLFNEVRPARGSVGEATNFWIVEGIALYMESLRCHSGYATVGGFDADRLQYSRHRALGEHFYIPLQEVVSLGRLQLQQHPEIRRLYTQAAGLTHFLMDFENQKYRPALLAYLRRVYESRDAADTLRQITDVDPRQLDAQYLEFLNVTDAMLAELSPDRQLEKLCLCQTSVSDDGLQRLAGQVRLTWLDVSRTAVTDKGLAVLAGARQLHQLNLAGTRVSDAALKTIGQLRSLEELDLSGTGITDEGVRQLAGLGDLRGLWLSGTHVTDAGLEHLYGLRNLEILDITNARVSTAGWQAISQALPGLAADAEGHQRGFEDRP